MASTTHLHHILGQDIPTPDDVFGSTPRFSSPSSPNLEGSFRNLSENRDPEGCLLSDQLDLPVVDEFADRVEELFLKCQKADEQNDLLVRLRDALLPKLISGEIRIPDAERLLEEVGI